MNIELRELHQDDGCNGLSLGDQNLTPLKTFLRKEAKKLHRDNLARTFVIAEKAHTKVLAYVTTLCTQISVEELKQSAPIEQFKYTDYPAIKLARLAVDTSLQGQGVGGRLVEFVIGIAVQHVMPHTGCRFLVVDAKPQSIGFYESKGFKRIGEAETEGEHYITMFMDLHHVKP